MREVDAREFALWVAEYRIAPFGDMREDLRAGVVGSVIANVNRRKGSPPFKPGDFVLKFGRERKSPEQLEREAKVFVQQHNAAVNARGKK